MAGNNRNPSFNVPRFRNGGPSAGLLYAYNHLHAVPAHGGFPFPVQQPNIPYPLPPQYSPGAPPLPPFAMAQADRSMSMSDLNNVQYGGGQYNRGDHVQQNRGGSSSRGRGANRQGGDERGGRGNRDRDNYGRGEGANRDRDDYDGHGNRDRDDYGRGGRGNRDRDDYDGRGNRDRDNYDGRGNRGRDDYDGRGNKGRDDYDDRGGRGNRDRDDYDNRGGRGIRDRDDYDGRGNRGRDDYDGHGNRGRGNYDGRGNRGRDDYDGRGNRGRHDYDGRCNRGRDDYDGRGNRGRDDYDGRGNRGRDDYDGRGNRVRDDYDGRGNRGRDDYDGRGNTGRDDYDGRDINGGDDYNDRGGRGDRDRDNRNNRGGQGNRDRGGRGNRRGMRKAFSTQDMLQTNFPDQRAQGKGPPRPSYDEQDNEYRGPIRGSRGGKTRGQRFMGRIRRPSGNIGSQSDLHDSDAESDRHSCISGSSEDLGKLPGSNDSRGRGQRRGRGRGRGGRGRRNRGQYMNQGDTTQPDNSDEETEATEGIENKHDAASDHPSQVGGKRKKGRNRRDSKPSDRSESVENIKCDDEDDDVDDDTEKNDQKGKETPIDADVLNGSNIRLNDIKLLNERILNSRLKRYKKKIAELKKAGATSKDLSMRYRQISEINRELARRKMFREDKGNDSVSNDLEKGSDDILDDDYDDNHDDDHDDAHDDNEVLVNSFEDSNDESDDFEQTEAQEYPDGKKQGANIKNSKSHTSAANSKDKDIDSLFTRLDDIITPGTEENIIETKTEAIPTFDRPTIKTENTKEMATRKPEVDISNEMFNFVVRMYEGKGDPDEIRRESGILPATMDAGNWFKYSKRFNTIERDGKVTTVFVFFKEISYCLDYIKKAGCTKATCERFHVCKDMLCSNCIYGDDKCNFSHNLLDERNIKIADALELSKVFSSEEICSILRVRYPHVCQAWNDAGTCNEGENCPDLHLCAEFVLNKCNQGPSCPRCHDRTTPHNKPIIAAFKMETWKDYQFKRMLYLKRTPKQQTEPIKDRPEKDFNENVYLCHLDLVGDCERRYCVLQHSSNKLPYLWQVNLFGDWKTVEKQEDIEKHYCNCSTESFNMTVDGLDMKFSFEPVFQATVLSLEYEVLQSTGLRRISTASYKDDDDGKASFKTQWRWYWQDDYSQWQLFEPDTLQHTLESKYLNQQEEYLYARENYKFPYTIEFKAMTQINMMTDKKRKLRRRPLYVGRQDVQTRTFCQALAEDPCIGLDLPANWDTLDVAHPFELVKLAKSCPEYIKLKRDFYQTLKSSEQVIDDIYRVQNHLLWTAFCNHEKAMKLNAQRSGGDGTVDKRSLFHGTDSMDAVRGISINNFDFRLAGKNATMFGNGAYFAVDAKYSHSYTKGPNRFMFQAQVLVGEYTLGDRSYKRPPNKPGKDHELYDSCVDNMQNPRIFIVAEKNQYYPEYLIQYHDERERINVSTAYPANIPVVYPAPSRTSNVQARQGSSSTLTPTSSMTPSMTPQPSPPSPAQSPQHMTYPSTSVAPGPAPAPVKSERQAKKDPGCSIQ